MNVLHISDTHLGRGAFQKSDPITGINIREQSIYDNYLSAVDEIIRLKPDLLIHTGDLFDVVKPKNKAIVVAMEGFERLNNAGIPVCIIAGNHSMVKTRSTASPYELFRYSHPEVTCIYKFHYNRCEFGDVMIHAIPNMLHPEDYAMEYSNLSPEPGYNNILMLHGLVPGINKKLNTFAEMEISSEMIQNPDIMYTALGHYHGQMAINDTAMYSGSLEYLTYGEASDVKGGVLLNTPSGGVKSVPFPHTPMRSLPAIECRDLSPSEITELILKSVSANNEYIMLQVTLNDILPDQFSTIDFQKITEDSRDLMHLNIKKTPRKADDAAVEYRDISTINYVDEFRAYLKKLDLTEKEMATVSDIGSTLVGDAL